MPLASHVLYTSFSRSKSLKISVFNITRICQCHFVKNFISLKGSPGGNRRIKKVFQWSIVAKVQIVRPNIISLWYIATKIFDPKQNRKSQMAHPIRTLFTKMTKLLLQNVSLPWFFKVQQWCMTIINRTDREQIIKLSFWHNPSIWL
jgi:hypothetical protein